MRTCGSCGRTLASKEVCYCQPLPGYDPKIEASPEAKERQARLEKLDTHDKYAEDALDALVAFMEDEPGLIIAAARGRHAEGSIRYGDRLMYEYDDATLRAEALQELADAVNYFVVLLSREKQS